MTQLVQQHRTEECDYIDHVENRRFATADTQRDEENHQQDKGKVKA
jgi:hypothetical protein